MKNLILFFLLLIFSSNVYSQTLDTLRLTLKETGCASSGIEEIIIINSKDSILCSFNYNYAAKAMQQDSLSFSDKTKSILVINQTQVEAFKNFITLLQNHKNNPGIISTGESKYIIYIQNKTQTVIDKNGFTTDKYLKIKKELGI